MYQVLFVKKLFYSDSQRLKEKAKGQFCVQRVTENQSSSKFFKPFGKINLVNIFITPKIEHRNRRSYDTQHPLNRRRVYK